MITRRSFAALAGATAVACRAQAQAAPLVALEQVAQFEMQVTGVAVAESGRIFVNFPRWEQDVPISVAEVGRDGSLKPYPNAEWNAWRNERKLSNEDHFVCVQSVTADRQGFLWILDPAAPGNEFNLDHGPKLVKVDLKTDRVVRTYLFDRTAAPQGSYLNDVRVSPDGRTAYMTDSGVRGALLVLDLASGRVKRVLDGAPSTQVEGDVVVMADGKPLKRPDGRGPAFAADGIALDPKGEFLFWQALAGRTLYQVPTAALRAGGDVAAKVKRVGTTCVADGYWIDRLGRLWITSPEDNSVKLWRGRLQTVVQDERLRWPDSMAEGPDMDLYVTSSHIQDMAQWHEKGSTRTMPYGLWRFTPPT